MRTLSEKAALLNDMESATKEGFLFVRAVGDADACGIQVMLFTFALCSGITRDSFEDRWCYHSLEKAVIALKAWNGQDGTEPQGWHKHPKTDRRRDQHGNDIGDERAGMA